MELPAAPWQAVPQQGWRGLVCSLSPILGLSRRLPAEGGEKLGFERHEMRCGDHLKPAWPGQVDHLYELHSPWSSRHDVHTVREENGLVHVMRHEYNRLVHGFPESE